MAHSKKLPNAIRDGAKKTPHVRRAYICSEGTCALGSAVDGAVGVKWDGSAEIQDTVVAMVDLLFPESKMFVKKSLVKEILTKTGDLKNYPTSFIAQQDDYVVGDQMVSIQGVVISLNDDLILSRERIAMILDMIFDELEPAPRTMTNEEIVHKMLEKQETIPMTQIPMKDEPVEKVLSIQEVKWEVEPGYSK